MTFSLLKFENWNKVTTPYLAESTDFDTIVGEIWKKMAFARNNQHITAD
ncbi:hypothetical protein JW964_17565 [candidate division KSB1 bacterium]|nr:hypothetical protein [candidate division KSB1 bacterium]